MDAANVALSMLPVRVGLDQADVTFLFWILETLLRASLPVGSGIRGPTFVSSIAGYSKKRAFQVICHQMSKVFDYQAVPLGSYA